MPVARLLKHKRMERCNNATKMQIRRRDVEMAERYRYMDFILYKKGGDALVEGVATFKYMGRPIDHTCDNWPEIRWNIKRASPVWGRLVKMLRREGGYSKMAEIFYMAVTQAVLLFGLDTWVLLSVMEKMMEGTHTCFLKHIMGKRAHWKSEGMWVTPRAEVIWEAVENQLTMTYVGRR